MSDVPGIYHIRNFRMKESRIFYQVIVKVVMSTLNAEQVVSVDLKEPFNQKLLSNLVQSIMTQV